MGTPTHTEVMGTVTTQRSGKGGAPQRRDEMDGEGRLRFDEMLGCVARPLMVGVGMFSTPFLIVAAIRGITGLEIEMSMSTWLWAFTMWWVGGLVYEMTRDLKR